jgi:thioredoxin reductase
LRRLPGGANIAPVVHDLVIVGAGPAGISTAVEAREAGIGRKRILILEKGPAHSYAIRKFYPEDKRVDALYKGIPDQTIQRWELNVHYADGTRTIRKQATGVELMSGEPLLKEGGETA